MCSHAWPRRPACVVGLPGVFSCLAPPARLCCRTTVCVVMPGPASPPVLEDHLVCSHAWPRRPACVVGPPGVFPRWHAGPRGPQRTALRPPRVSGAARSHLLPDVPCDADWTEPRDRLLQHGRVRHRRHHRQGEHANSRSE